jgi:hypothetical protein
VWLDDGHSLFDTFGFDWTPLRIGRYPPSGDRLRTAATAAGMCALYEAPLALIRPDQIVAWRGERDADAAAAVQTVLGGGSGRWPR